MRSANYHIICVNVPQGFRCRDVSIFQLGGFLFAGILARKHQENKKQKTSFGKPLSVGEKKPVLPCPLLPRILRNLLGFGRRVLRKKGLLKKSSAQPQRVCRTLGAKPSFSDPAEISPMCLYATTPRDGEREMLLFLCSGRGRATGPSFPVSSWTLISQNT